jgi:hypothetical protein
MKGIRKQAKNTHDKILGEDGGFLEEVLYPIVDANNAERRGRAKAKRAAWIAAPVAVLLVAVILTTYFLTKPDTTTPYLGNYQTRAADIDEINANLSLTQVSGDIQEIVMTYETRTNKAVAFSFNQEVVTAGALITCATELIIERNYRSAEYNNQNGSFPYLDSLVEYTETVSESAFEDIPVNIFSVRAAFDTGQEIYHLIFEEVTANAESGFRAFIQSMITKKL